MTRQTGGYALLAPRMREAVDSLSDEILLAMPPEELRNLSDEVLRASGLLSSLPPGLSGKDLMRFSFALANRFRADRQKTSR
jgi:hypothetical protein